MEEEHRVHGGVKYKIYWDYIKAGKFKYWAVLLFLLTAARLADVGQSYFLKEWGEAYNRPLPVPQTSLLVSLTDFHHQKAILDRGFGASSLLL